MVFLSEKLCINHHHNHQLMLISHILLTLSLSLSLSLSSFLIIHPYYSLLLAGPLDGIKILHDMMYSIPYWSANCGDSLCKSMSENVIYEFVLTSSAVPHVFCSFLLGRFVR